MSKITRSHPVNELLGQAITAVREVRKLLTPNTVLTHRDAVKITRLIEETRRTRYLAIYRARRAGFTVREVAAMFEITPARVSQICKAHRAPAEPAAD